VQLLFQVLLIGVLAAAVCVFAVMGLLQYYRTRSLGRHANEAGLRFSPADPFRIPCRYADFALIGRGHSVRAENVTYGWLNGWPIRAFDLRYEIGHGTRRITRHYHVFVAETAGALPSVLMWNLHDAEASPLVFRQAGEQKACWDCLGNEKLIDAFVEICRPLADRGLSLQISGLTLMFCMPQRSRRGSYSHYLPEVAKILDAAGSSAGVQPATMESSDHRQERSE